MLAQLITRKGQLIYIQMSQYVIELTAGHRVAMLGLIAVQAVLFVYSNLLLSHFAFLPLPFLFNSPSLVDPIKTEETYYIQNGCIYTIFWLQHILMATLRYKLAWTKTIRWFPLYDRYFYNIASAVALLVIINSVQPCHELVFELPISACIVLAIGGVTLLTISIYSLGKGIFMPFQIAQILTSRQLVIPAYSRKSQEGLKVDGIYRWSRNPMQAGTLLLLLFASPILTIDKIIFTVVMVSGVLIGVIREQKRMLHQFKGYSEYMRQVKWRFYPYLF